MQSYQTLIKFIRNAREISHTNQRLAQLTHLIDRDLSSACMPQLHPLIESNKAKGLSDDQSSNEKSSAPESDKQAPDDEKKKQEEKRREERKKYFFAEIDDADFHKFKGKKVELLKACSFITTHALELYGESSPRWVRVRYELVRDKKAKVEQYTLIRKQTTDINNVKMKISEVDPTANLNNPITQYEVMRGIRGLFIEFSMFKEPEKKDNHLDSDKKIEQELVKAFAWGEAKKTSGEFPQRAHLYIDLWNDEQTRSDMMESEIFILTTGDVEKVLTAEKEQRRKLEQGSAVKRTSDGSGGGALAEFMKKVQAGQQPQAQTDDPAVAKKSDTATAGKGPNPVDAILDALDPMGGVE